MLKSLVAGSIALLAAFVMHPNGSQAGTDVGVGAGVYPAHYYPDYPDYLGYPHYYDYGSEYISCGVGRRIVRAYGFNRIKVLRCGGEIYQYQALRHYQPWIVRVSARSGRIIGARPLRGYY